MSWFYFSPFLCGLRNRSLRRGNFSLNQPMFAVLYGQRNCGKSSLVDTPMFSMFRYGRKSFVPNNAFTPVEHGGSDGNSECTRWCSTTYQRTASGSTLSRS